MLSAGFERELRERWLPHVTEAGLERITGLLAKASPLLLNGQFTGAAGQGCLATHVAWHHPETAHRSLDAGILWLSRVARLNPATSVVLLDWDRHGPHDFGFRTAFLDLLHAEADRRRVKAKPAARKRQLAH